MSKINEFYVYYASLYPSGLPKGDDEIAIYMEHMGASLRSVGATIEEARNACRVMVLDPPKGRPEHIPKLINAIRAIRVKAKLENPEPQISERENYERTISDGCPECTHDGKATGWATRRFFWACGTKPIMSVQIFCRCPYGRWRRNEEQGVKFPNEVGWSMTHDLQALPELWDERLNHETWSDATVRDDVPADEFDGQWIFLHPNDPSPKVADVETIKNIAERSRRIDRGKALWTDGTPKQLYEAEEKKREYDGQLNRPETAYEAF